MTNDESATGLTPERIVAYLDGELPPAERDAVAQAIAGDPAATRMAAEMQAAALAAAAAFADMAATPAPERLGRLLAERTILSFQPRRAAWRRAIVPAAAASIGLLLLASIALVPRERGAPLRPASDGDTNPAQDRFTAALYGALDSARSGETVAYGAPSPQAGGQITLLGELATRSGLACREFSAETHGGGSGMVQAGIACRRPDQGWDVLTEPRP